MLPNRVDQPGRIIFLSGVVLVIVATGLGFTLARQDWGENAPLDWHLPGYDEQLAAVQAKVHFLSNVQAMMWLTFALGVSLTMVGLRMLIHPPLVIEASGPIKPVLDVFEE